ncbi:MAG: thymidylate synthase [Pseudomonadota bacterium]
MSLPFKALGAIGALLILAGCGGDGSPFIAGSSQPDAATPDPGTPTDVPDVLAGNLASASFNSTDDTWSIVLTSLDAGTETGVYTRDGTLDVDIYEAYTVQDDALDRHFTLLVAESVDGAIRAGTVADGGQFNRYFGGMFYERTGAYDPATGLAEYSGTYAAVTNINGNGAPLLAPPGAADPLDLPAQAGRIEGTVFMNVDFVDNTINGAIRNRVLIDDSLDLPDVVLVVGDIDSDGEFIGGAELEDQTAIGTYGGIIGGTDGQFLGGGTSLAGFTDDFDNEEEYGVFVLENCDTSGAAVCP